MMKIIHSWNILLNSAYANSKRYLQTNEELLSLRRIDINNSIIKFLVY